MAIPMRQALVLGNDAYSKENRLASCVNDAMGMTNCLLSIGFQANVRKNLDYNSMQAVTKQFIRSIQPGAIVLFYFSGHGIQFDGYNFLIPTNDEGISSKNVKFSALSAERLIQDMHSRRPRVVIVILDSCRFYWGPGSLLRVPRADGALPGIRSGLAPMQVPPATIVGYACAAEATSSANSRNGRNSMYTYHLLRFIATPNVDIDHVLRNVAYEVQRDTNNTQIPYRYSSCNEYICLVGSTGMNMPPWLGVMQPNAVFPQFKNLYSNIHSNRYFQPSIDHRHNRLNYQYYQPKHYHPAHMYDPPTVMRYHTGFEYSFPRSLYWRRY